MAAGSQGTQLGATQYTRGPARGFTVHRGPARGYTVHRGPARGYKGAQPRGTQGPSQWQTHSCGLHKGPAMATHGPSQGVHKGPATGRHTAAGFTRAQLWLHRGPASGRQTWTQQVAGKQGPSNGLHKARYTGVQLGAIQRPSQVYTGRQPRTQLGPSQGLHWDPATQSPSQGPRGPWGYTGTHPGVHRGPPSGQAASYRLHRGPARPYSI